MILNTLHDILFFQLQNYNNMYILKLLTRVETKYLKWCQSNPFQTQLPTLMKTTKNTTIN